MSDDLFPGATISTTLGSLTREATLGVLVRDATDDAFYGVTASDFFIACQPVNTTGQKRKRVGAPAKKFAPTPETDDVRAMDMVGFIKVAADVTLSDRNPGQGLPITKTAPPSSAVGEPLTLLCRRGEVPVALEAYYIEFEFEDHHGAVHVVSNGIEIADESGRPFERGDAGAPVVTQERELIGVIVAIAGSGAIVAGLHEPFKELGLEVYIAARDRYRVLAGEDEQASRRNEGSVRIAGVTLPYEKRVQIALTYIYGVGRKTAKDICIAVGVPDERRVKDLSIDEINAIRRYIDDNVTVEGDLRRQTVMNIKRLVDLACYRGLRHRRGLPVRGQRTHTNARTRKGPAKAIAGKKK